MQPGQIASRLPPPGIDPGFIEQLGAEIISHFKAKVQVIRRFGERERLQVQIVHRDIVHAEPVEMINQLGQRKKNHVQASRTALPLQQTQQCAQRLFVQMMRIVNHQQYETIRVIRRLNETAQPDQYLPFAVQGCSGDTEAAGDVTEYLLGPVSRLSFHVTYILFTTESLHQRMSHSRLAHPGRPENRQQTATGLRLLQKMFEQKPALPTAVLVTGLIFSGLVLTFLALLSIRESSAERSARPQA
jgi:hypothetical protein